MALWKGYLKLSLVTCPVAMLPATSDSEKLRFHTINKATGNRVKSRFVDAVTGKPVAEADEVKGYPRGDDQFVMLEDAELKSMALESTRTIDIEMFVPKDSIQWIWFDTPHFLMPNDKIGVEAFAVIREAMKATGMVGISRLVLYRRERAVMLDARGNGIVLWTLRYGDEVRDAAPYFAGIKEAKPDPKLTKLVAALVKQHKQPWSPDMVSDPVQTRLTEIIRSKRKAKPRGKRKDKEAPSNVVDIMEALRKSLQKDRPS
jgi:DNA end-binding protein Ku